MLATPGPESLKKDNHEKIKTILRLRHEKATLLGYKSHTEVSMATKMATVESAHKLLEELRVASKAAGERELEELKKFAIEEIEPVELRFPADKKFEQWDVSFYAEKMKEARYLFNEEELKPYFSLPKVKAGLWSLANRLFDVDVEELSGEEVQGMGISLWHEDVQVRDVRIFWGIFLCVDEEAGNRRIGSGEWVDGRNLGWWE